MTQSFAARAMDKAYDRASGIGGEQYVAAVCGGQSSRVLWTEDGGFVPDGSGETLPETTTSFQYRAWTLTTLAVNATVTVTFLPRTCTEAPRVVVYVVRSIFPNGDGLERTALVAAVNA